MTTQLTLNLRDESYYQLTDSLGDRQQQVLDMIRVMGRVSNRQLSELLHLPINSITGRVRELRDKGLVTECGTTYDEVTNRTVTLFKAV
jgi:DNA-binding MarR family transcriptional regulator